MGERETFATSDIGKALQRIYDDLMENAVKLPNDVERIIHENLWQLYQTDATRPPEGAGALDSKIKALEMCDDATTFSEAQRLRAEGAGEAEPERCGFTTGVAAPSEGTHVDYCDEMRPCPIHEARGSDQGDDLLEWLRESQQATAFDEDARMYGRAADEIESLRARLRGVSTGEWIDSRGHCSSTMDGCPCIYPENHAGVHHDGIAFWGDEDADDPTDGGEG